MIEKNDCVPGNIVVLGVPVRMSSPGQQLLHNVESGEMIPGVEYHSWLGFTHGIIAYVEGPHEVYLYLYDPATESIYIDRARSMPVRVQFSVDEIALWQRAGEFDFSIGKDDPNERMALEIIAARLEGYLPQRYIQPVMDLLKKLLEEAPNE